MSIAYLFVPGSSEKKIAKSFESKADVVIIDLEDSVKIEEKVEARRLISTAVNNIPNHKKRTFLRVNAMNTPWIQEDISLAQQLKLDGIMIPKVEEASDIIWAQNQTELEIIPLIESARGILNLKDIILASTTTKRIAFGSVDYALDIGAEWTAEGEERKIAMNTLVLLSRYYNLEPPVDAVYPDIHDQESLQRDAKFGKQLGFFGKMVIHPKHIDWVNHVYQPSKEQIEWCQLVVQAYDDNNQDGAFQLDGKLIDLPIYMKAKRTLAMVNRQLVDH
ncbi:CoA ester lyase [Geomicrobium sp. JCM 19038]|uniref:HpcH/HpaI aldolase/citrate lyase family protein n=1 Tax=Geomicrobium sp. JCM 19038 TaxID=1460635 RepID=UPI00045F2196|nr:CoA ester lyase [Geomicrobium sp. JCM 19038]GAK09883.1 citrate lyase beta chain [Geomicrobium sp. JCM 19038]